MKKSTSRSRRYLITKNSILLLVMLVVIFMAVWAWFIADNSTANASGLKIAVAEPGDMQIALPYKGSYPKDTDPASVRFSDSIDFTQSSFFSTDMFGDVTSDGINFIIPTFEVDKDNNRDGRIVVPEGEWSEAVSSKAARSDEGTDNDDKFDYVAIDFYLRSPEKKINVLSSSYLAAKSDIDSPAKPLKITSGNVDTDLYRSCGNLYGQGKFSADALVGAMRVSLVGQSVVGQTESGSGETLARTDTYLSGSSPSLGFLWLPRPDICLNTGNDINTPTSDWTLITGITPNNANYVNKTYRHSCYIPKDFNIKREVIKHTYYDDYIADSISNSTDKASYIASPATNPTAFHVSKGNGTATAGYYPVLGKDCSVAPAGNPTMVTFTDENSVSTDYYVYKMTLNIWIEGEDAEARRAMGSGKFKLQMYFG